MAQGVVENMIILLWSCTVGLVLVLPVLLFMRRAWFPEDEKQLEQAKNPVGAALMGLLRESSSTRHVPLRSNPSENSQVSLYIYILLATKRWTSQHKFIWFYSLTLITAITTFTWIGNVVNHNQPWWRMLAHLGSFFSLGWFYWRNVNSRVRMAAMLSLETSPWLTRIK